MKRLPANRIFFCLLFSLAMACAGVGTATFTLGAEMPSPSPSEAILISPTTTLENTHIQSNTLASPQQTEAVLRDSWIRAENLPALVVMATPQIGNEFAWGNSTPVIAVGSMGTVTVYSIEEGKLDPVYSLKTHPTITELTFSPDDRWIAVGYYGTPTSISIFDTNTRKEKCAFGDAGMRISALDFSPDSRMLASGDLIGNARVWDVETCAVLKEFPDYKPYGIEAVDFNPRGGQLVFAGKGPFICDMPAWECGFPGEGEKFAGDLEFHPDGSYLAIVSAGNSDIRIVSAKDRTQEHSIHLQKTGLFGVTFSVDGKMLVVTRGGDSGVFHFLDAYSEEELFSILTPLRPTRINFDPEGRFLVGSGNSDQLLFLTVDEHPEEYKRELKWEAAPLIGCDVWIMQERLLALGYTYLGTVDGVFGERTDIAVRQFQAKNDLAQDGIVGAVTWKVLFSATAVRATAEAA